MENNLMIFEGNNVEVFKFGGKVLFNPRHVGKCLELGESSIRMAIKEMNEKQVIKLKNSDVNSIDIRKLNNAGENFITESGVYKLIFKSRKENAEKFQDWVTDEVLPQIRKTGSYQSQQKALEVFNDTLDSLQQTISENKETIEEYKNMCKINSSKKRNYTDYIKKRLGINKSNSEYEQVKARVFFILNINKWEDISLETSKQILNIIDESIGIIKKERPYEQLSCFN